VSPAETAAKQRSAAAIERPRCASRSIPPRERFDTRGVTTMPGDPPVRRSSWLVSDEPQRLGSGWLAGTFGAVLGLATLGIAACLAWPDLLTTPALRAHLPACVRALAIAGAALAIAAGCVSALLRRKKSLAVVAIGSALLAAALLALAPPGPANAGSGPRVALDVFVLNLLAYAAVFVPLERLWPHRGAQPTFRDEWWTDLAWFVSSALLVQVTAFLVLAPGNALSALAPRTLASAIASLPLVLQFLLIVVVADLVQYWTHRAFHRVPWLWRLHEVHHSATAMDWLAGSRLHLLDALLTRAAVFAGIALLGFDVRAIAIYLVFVAAQATFVHANVAWRLRWLEPWLVTPRFHHWHHADAPPDVNFAVHLPWLDRLFGTHHLPGDAWPERYGLVGGATGPRGFWRQLFLLSGRRASR
jgi:sterol desaturase/sphingolipid hydroxylase (fatty acid hydroxylase superfamily)